MDIEPKFYPTICADEIWLHEFGPYEDDLIANFATAMKADYSIVLRVRGTNMKTLHERGEQFARFNFEIIV